MLNVCFSDSEQGMLLEAFPHEAVGRGFGNLAYGGIEGRRFLKERRRWMREVYARWFGKDALKQWRSECAGFRAVIETARREGEVRLWYGSTPFVKCGAYHLIAALQEVDCRIYVVEMPQELGTRELTWDKSWGELAPSELAACLSLQRELDRRERAAFTEEWRRLAEENAALRVNLGPEKRLTSVPADYLDGEILKKAPTEGEFRIVTLIGEAIGGCPHHMHAVFVYYRIEEMIAKGIFKVVGKNKSEPLWMRWIRRVDAD
ncbi:MAG: DUF1835 domain-containing protein [Clostridia bacterium]|nr:DUF1835 domain-containing protein [Clostridia bacterium]